MSLPNYLAQIKSSGIYRFVWDKSEIAGVDAEILRLVVGYSEKGPFNTPVYIKKDTDFKNIFGDISKKLEKRGIWFHRLALQALAKGPIIALNLKKFENETVKACSFNVVDTFSDSTLKPVSVESIYDTTRFWKLDPEAILPATGETNKYISLTSADSKETSCSVFIRGYKPTGYDVTIKNWYSAQGEEVPDYFVTGEKDYSSLLVSDFFAEVYVFRGKFTPAICASDPLNKYFDIIGGVPQLKEFIVNGFGEKIDTLTALASDEASNFINSYSGCLLPFFKNQNNTYISLDLSFNADNDLHKMMMNLNSDLLYNGEITPDQITTTCWLDSEDKAFGTALKKTTEVCSALEPTVDKKGVKTYDYTYEPEFGKEATAFDYDLIKFVGAAGENDKIVKYLGGCEYDYSGEEDREIYGSTVKVSVFTAVGEKYADSAEAIVYEGVTWIWQQDETTSEYVLVKSELQLEDPEALDLTALPDQNPTVTPDSTVELVVNGETITADGYTVSKITESDVEKIVIAPFASPVTLVEKSDAIKYESMPGAEIKLLVDSLYDNEFITFEDTNSTKILFRVSNSAKQPETVTTRYLYEGTDDSYKAYHNTVAGATISDLYLLPVTGKLYTKDDTTGEYVELEGDYTFETYSLVKGELDFVSAGIVVGDRVLFEGDFYTITALDKDFAKAADFDGNEVTISKKDTFTKCNHSASIASYNLKPVYFEGYTYENPMPLDAYGKPSTKDWDKLQWHNKILSTLIDYRGLRTGLTSRTDIDYRYIVDTFEGLVDTELHRQLTLIGKEKDNALVFVNFPSAKAFKDCTYTSFTDEKGRFDTKYIKEGGNKKKNPGLLFSLASEVNGASFASYNSPLLFTDGTVKTFVPSAALVSNAFMDKYISRQPYYIVAGPTYGRMIYSGLVGPDFNYTRADLDILEPMGVNVMVYVPRLGTYINSNQTAKQNPVTALSKINVRELVIYLQDEIEKLLQDYQWEFNTPYLRDLVKAKADTICERVKNNGGIYEYLNVCDESNNTDDVINNEMFVLSTSIEPGMGCGKMVQELTIYKKGGMQAIIK